MATLVFAKEFLDDFAKLDPSVRQKVRELPGKFEDAVHTGVHLEKLHAARDDRVRTVRVDQFWRGVVVRLGDGRYALLRVLPHDEAIDCASRQRFEVNSRTGLIEILDIPQVEAKVAAISSPVGSEASGLFAARRDRDFSLVGVDKELIPLLRRIGTEAELYAIASYLPAAQSDAVLLLADGKSPEEVWAELSRDYDLSGEAIDTSDIDKALQQPGTLSGFVVTTSDSELVELLSGDFEAWRTFLHPSQRALAYRPVFRGPAKVTGGAGTGKTIVAIHRCRFLAQQLIDANDTTGQVLFATYTKSLADNLDRILRGFCTLDQYRRIHVSTVDAFASQTLAASKSRARPIQSDALQHLADQAALMAGLDNYQLDGRFLITEWEQVILARKLTSLMEYVMSPRPGRGKRLARAIRKAIWSALEYLLLEFNDDQRTFLQIADAAADVLNARSCRPFAHVIVDEAQDLHPAQWRLLRAAVTIGENDLFIVGDAHQRIYDYRVSLLSLGIDTRGRSRRLKINYRTSQQILSWALGILRDADIDDLDGNSESQVGYRSALDGPVPTIKHFTAASEEGEFVAKVIQGWLADGVTPSAIGVVARTREDLRTVHSALQRIGIRSSEEGIAHADAIQSLTMHSSKGLEFARLAVVSVNADNLPHPRAITPVTIDEAQHTLDILRERCLLYVACTRARDELIITSSGSPSSLLPTLL